MAWTEEGRAHVRDTASALAAAVLAHGKAIAALDSERQGARVFHAGEKLLAAVSEYVDAQIEFAGSGYPLVGLRQLIDLEGEEEDAEDRQASQHLPEQHLSGVSFLQRTDYAITDEVALLAAGRAAYKDLWPDYTDQDAAAEVRDANDALYQLAHAHEWFVPAELDGLQLKGSVSWLMQQDETLGPDISEWPHDLFDVHGEVLHAQTLAFRQKGQ